MKPVSKSYSDQPLPIQDEDVISFEEESTLDLPVSSEKHYLFKGILRNILPYLGSDEGKIVLTLVMVSLKLEGVVGKQLDNKETTMVNVIKDAILSEPSKKKQALQLARQLLE
jgi:hypothetical protein